MTGQLARLGGNLAARATTQLEKSVGGIDDLVKNATRSVPHAEAQAIRESYEELIGRMGRGMVDAEKAGKTGNMAAIRQSMQSEQALLADAKKFADGLKAKLNPGAAAKPAPAPAAAPAAAPVANAAASVTEKEAQFAAHMKDYAAKVFAADKSNSPAKLRHVTEYATNLRKQMGLPERAPGS